MTKNKNLQNLLKQRDEELLALYRQINDPEPPRAPEPLGRISRYLRPADLGKLA